MPQLLWDSQPLNIVYTCQLNKHDTAESETCTCIQVDTKLRKAVSSLRFIFYPYITSACIFLKPQSWKKEHQTDPEKMEKID